MNCANHPALQAITESLARIKNISGQTLLESSPLAYERIFSSKKGGVTWEELNSWIRWLDEVHAPVDWQKVGAGSLVTSSVPIIKTIAQSCNSLRFCYWFANKWIGPAHFPGIRLSYYQEISGCEIKLTLERPEGLHCPQLFELFRGANSHAPTVLFDLPSARIEMQTEGRLVHYHLFLPQELSLWSKLKLGFRTFFGVRHILKELVEQQQKLNEAFISLESERQEMRLLLEQFPDGIIIHDESGIQFINRRMLSYLGVSANHYLGKSPVELLIPEHQAMISQRIQNFKFYPDIVNPPIECHFTRPGQAEPFQSESNAVRMNYNGKPSIVVIVRDLMERNKLQERLIHQDRLTGLGRLAAGVGHEINNPLAYALLNVTQLQGLTTLSPEASKQLLEVRKGLERIQFIVRDLKTVSRGPRSEAPVPVDLRSVLDTSINMTRNLIWDRAQMVTQIDEIPRVLGSEAKFAQVFVNLLINAAEAIKPGNNEENEVSVRAFSLGGKQIVIQIRDTGCGIPTEIQGRLFDPFFTTKPVGQGTGLGLSICHSLIQQFGGTITLTSEVGRGTLIQVSFPAWKELITESTPDSALEADLRGRVLLIDDNMELLNSLASVIGGFHDVVSTEGGAEAFAAIEREPSFDCILCDLMMPKMSGVEFYERLSESHPQLKSRVIFMTGGSFTPETDDFLRQPKIRFVEKPLALNELRPLISELVRKKTAADFEGTPS